MTPAPHRRPGRGLRARFPPGRDLCSARGVARASVLRTVRKPQRNPPDRLERIRISPQTPVSLRAMPSRRQATVARHRRARTRQEAVDALSSYPSGTGWPGCGRDSDFLATFWRPESPNLALLSQISPYRVGLRNRRSQVRILSGAYENPHEYWGSGGIDLRSSGPKVKVSRPRFQAVFGRASAAELSFWRLFWRRLRRSRLGRAVVANWSLAS